MMNRRSFVQQCSAGSVVAAASIADGVALLGAEPYEAQPIESPNSGEDIFAYIERVTGDFDETLYAQILGAANEYKEGDEIIGVSAVDQASRDNARRLLGATRMADIDRRPVFTDKLLELIQQDPADESSSSIAGETIAELKSFLLSSDQAMIKRAMPGLSSDVIACVVKLMDNDELIQVGRKVFNPLPGSKIGAQGYLSAPSATEFAHRQHRRHSMASL